jgi:hypothetical protein
MTGRTVLFVCPHGAGKSRLAAAWFNGMAVDGWWATSAGVEPQATVSAHAPRLLAGTPVAYLLDTAPPRPLSAVRDAAVVVAIDCPTDLALGQLDWHLDNAGFGAALAAEIRERVQDLAQALGDGLGAAL